MPSYPQYSSQAFSEKRSCGCRRITRRCCPEEWVKVEYWRQIRHVWQGMKDRCENTKSKAYRWYGARGITVCDEWQDLFNFYDWAMANGFCSVLQIDRKENWKGYGPGNCRFIWADEQHQNTRRKQRKREFSEVNLQTCGAVP